MIALSASEDPTGQLGPEPWLVDMETVAVMEALQAEGADARFVGGCVRDSIARRPVYDIDIATPDVPSKIIDLMKNAGIRTVETGIEHGTITAITENRTFEITTLRKDIETMGRRAVVAFTEDWIVDSERRDFTFNALSARMDGAVFDYHEGIPDLAHGKVRFIGRAEDRVLEDYLRILRYFRFYGSYGRPPADKDALHACSKHAGKLSDLSSERVRAELLKIIMVPDAADVFILMREARVLDVILPEATEIGTLRAVSWLARRGLVIDGLAPDPIRRMGAVLKPDTDVSAVSQRLRLSNRETDRLGNMLQLAPQLAPVPDAAGTRQLINQHGGEAVLDASIVAWGARLADVARLPASESQARREQVEAALGWQAPEFPLTGDDVKSFGLSQGPEIGALLRAVETWWAAGDFTADRDACLKELERLIRDR